MLKILLLTATLIIPVWAGDQTPDIIRPYFYRRETLDESKVRLAQTIKHLEDVSDYRESTITESFKRDITPTICALKSPLCDAEDCVDLLEHVVDKIIQYKDDIDEMHEHLIKSFSRSGLLDVIMYVNKDNRECVTVHENGYFRSICKTPQIY